jgi:acetyl esterase
MGGVIWSSPRADALGTAVAAALLPNDDDVPHLVPFAEAALQADVRAFATPLLPLFSFMQSVPWFVSRMLLDMAGGADPPLPGAPPPLQTACEMLSADGSTKLAARIYEPQHLAGGKSAPLVFFVHGGGWCMGSLAMYVPQCRALANELGYRVLAVTYRLAPESQYPAAALDVLAAYKYVAAHGADFGLDETMPQIIIAGDSAGGQLTLELGLRVRDTAGLTQPVLLAPIYPAVNMRGGETASWVRFGKSFGLQAHGAHDMLRAYLGATPELRSKHASNAYLNADLRTDFAGVAPMVLMTAEFDILGDEGREFVKTANARGADVEHIFAKGHLHGALAGFSKVPSAVKLLKELCARIKARVEGGGSKK